MEGRNTSRLPEFSPADKIRIRGQFLRFVILIAIREENGDDADDDDDANYDVKGNTKIVITTKTMINQNNDFIDKVTMLQMLR